jgi:hypothetical protein
MWRILKKEKKKSNFLPLNEPAEAYALSTFAFLTSGSFSSVFSGGVYAKKRKEEKKK